MLYLAVRILVLCAEDVAVNIYADINYPYLEPKIKVSSEYKKSLFSNVKALMWHKVGGVLSRSTDSLLLTYFVGLSGMGKYSNYALIIGTVGAFFDVAVNAVGASVGNLGAVDRGEKSEKVLRRLYFLNFWMLTVGTCVIVSILNPFIELWLGRQMLFTNAEMLVIVSSFYFSCIRDPVQIFVSTYGLFKESKYIPILRAAVNLVLSVVFVLKLGVAGVFLGTALSTVTVPLFGEVKVLYKHGFSLDPKGFYKEMAGYIFVSAVCVAACFYMSSWFAADLVGVAIRCIFSFCISNVILLVFYSGSEFFADLSQILRKYSAGLKKSKL
jgi:O-antigen/teichoic acid export membrane protein